MNTAPFPTRRKVIEAMKAKDIGAASATAKCLKEDHAKAVAEGKAHGWSDLTSMKAAFTAAAQKPNIPDATLAEFYARQVEWCGKRVRQLTKALELSYERMAGPEDPSWPKLWATDAKLRWYTETGRGLAPLLQERGHILVCPQHGVQGVDASDWAPFAGEQSLFDLWDALSMRGLVTEGGMKDWMKACEACAGSAIDQVAGRLMKGARP